MKPDFSQEINALVKHAEARHAAIEALNHCLGGIESALVQLKLGVAVSLPLFSDSSYYLHFRKLSDGWGLFIEYTSSVEPLSSASFAHRLEALRMMPKLLDVIREEADAQVREVHETMEAVSGLISASPVNFESYSDLKLRAELAEAAVISLQGEVASLRRILREKK